MDKVDGRLQKDHMGAWYDSYGFTTRRDAEQEYTGTLNRIHGVGHVDTRVQHISLHLPIRNKCSHLDINGQ